MQEIYIILSFGILHVELLPAHSNKDVFMLKWKFKSLLILTLLMSINLAKSHTHFTEMLKDDRNLFVTVKYFDYHLQMLDFISKDLEILGVDLKRGYIDLYLSDSEYDWLKSAGYQLNIRNDKSILLRPDTEYKNPAEVESFLKDMHARYPDLTKLVSIGKSIEGRDIWAIKISDNPNTDETEPAILFNSMHHAREVMTPEISMDIVEYLLTRYEGETKVRHWVDSNEIWVIPMLNVDGNNRVWDGNSMWRKNVRGGYGVDVNRNYPYKWGACNGSSGSRWSQTYRGESAGSEPETQALMNLVASVRPVFDISYHSYSELVLYPFGCRGEKTATHAVIAGIGNRIGSILDYRPGTPWEILYGVDGGDVDWMYDQHQVIPYVIELNSSREGFQPRYDQWRDKTVEKNRPAWQYLLDRLDETAVRGVLKNSEGEVEKDFVVKVEQVTSTGGLKLFQKYKSNPDGSFHIVLNPGKYKFTFSKGSRSTKVEALEVSDKRVELSPVLD